MSQHLEWIKNIGIMIIETNTTTASCVEPMIHIGHCPTQSGNKNFSDFN